MLVTSIFSFPTWLTTFEKTISMLGVTFVSVYTNSLNLDDAKKNVPEITITTRSISILDF